MKNHTSPSSIGNDCSDVTTAKGPQLTLVPIGGLCNRLRAVLSAWHYGEQHPACSITMEWAENPDCQAAWQDLFAIPDVPRFRMSAYHAWNAPATKRNLYLPRLLRRFIYDYQLFDYSEKSTPALHDLLRPGKRVWLSTGYAFSPYPAAYYRKLRPTPALQQRVEKIVESFGPHCIGVHIRRTDNIKAMEAASVEDFRQAMLREARTDADVRFYLATDDPAVKRQLVREMGERVIVQPTRDIHRDTVPGMQDAVVDLFCLAATQKILGSFWSSFTDTAAEMGGIPVEIVGKPQPPSA